MHRYHHIALAVPDVVATMAEIGGALGLTWRPLQTFASEVTDSAGTVHDAPVLVTYSVEGHPAIEIFRAVPGSPLDAPSGSPFHHAGVWVDDVKAEGARLESEGWSFYGKPGTGRQLLYRGPSGMVLELCDVHADRPWLCDLFPEDSPHYHPDPPS